MKRAMVLVSTAAFVAMIGTASAQMEGDAGHDVWVGEYTPHSEESANVSDFVTINPQTLLELFIATEKAESLNAGLFGSRKDYCCRNNQDGRTKVIQASNTISAMTKCMWHYAARPVTIYRGTCR